MSVANKDGFLWLTKRGSRCQPKRTYVANGPGGRGPGRAGGGRGKGRGKGGGEGIVETGLEPRELGLGGKGFTDVCLFPSSHSVENACGCLTSFTGARQSVRARAQLCSSTLESMETLSCFRCGRGRRILVLFWGFFFLGVHFLAPN